MARTRFEIRAELELLSPMHVGSGATRQVKRVRGRDGANEAPEVAAILRDWQNKPVISGATMKGLLRRIAERLGFDDTRLESLLGSIKDEGRGRTGALAIHAATLKRAGTSTDLPYADATSGTDADLGEGVYVAARTRIDAQSGTAARNKLFHQEMVAPGARFDLFLTLDRRAYARRDDRDAILEVVDEAESHAETALDATIELLGELAASRGYPVGKGQADGQGRLRLVASTLKVEKQSLDATGTFGRETSTIGALLKPHGPAAKKEVELTMVCRDPFLVLDSSYVKAKGDDRQPHLRGQRFQGRAFIQSAGIAGALRARAAWIAALDRHRAGIEGPVDDPDTPYEQGGEVRDLTPVERLFGVTGYRGLLEIRDGSVSAGEPWTVTSVKLDRFSGAPIDNALFATQAFVGTRITLRLALTERKGATAGDEATHLFDRLVTDIGVNGLELGHGGSKGFGWFQVAE